MTMLGGVGSRPDNFPSALSTHHYKKDEEKRIRSEVYACGLLLDKLQSASSTSRNLHQYRDRIKALQLHITQSKALLAASPPPTPEEIALPVLQMIERIYKKYTQDPSSKEALSQAINELPTAFRYNIEGMVYALHPQRRNVKHWGREALKANPQLLFTLKDITTGETIFSKINQVALSQLSLTTRPDLHNYLGAHLKGDGAVFRVYAPNAKSVALQLTPASSHTPGLIPMTRVEGSGVWEIDVRDIRDGQTYWFAVEGADGKVRYKADPFAFEAVEKRDRVFRHESIVRQRDNFTWSDRDWMSKRKQGQKTLNIYEMHVTAWDKVQNYAELAERLAKYCKELNYTHVELMGLLSHPCQGSMGYQVTNYFAPNFRLGSLSEIKAFINCLHRQGIGVVLDFSSAHFAVDGFALERFDGTPLFEKIYPLYQHHHGNYHPQWKSYEFKFDSSWVRDFLASSVMYWLEDLHIDAVRFDAVSNTLAKNYARGWGHYIPNHKGGHEDFDGAKFFREMNAALHAKYPEVVLIAENSSYTPHLKKPASQGGLEFDLDWNFSRQADFLQFFSTPFDKREKHWYWIENAIKVDGRSSLTVSSHDEFSHGKKSLLRKMPGAMAQKFAGSRLYHSMLYSVPGRGVMSCMGTEFAQPEEWSRGFIHPKSGVRPVQWEVLKDRSHRGVLSMVRDLGALYLQESSLHSLTPVQHLDTSDKRNCVARYIRHAPGGRRLLFIHNFSPNTIERYRVPIPGQPSLYASEIFNSDQARYGGSGVGNPRITVANKSLAIRLPALSTLIIELGDTPFNTAPVRRSFQVIERPQWEQLFSNIFRSNVTRKSWPLTAQANAKK